MPEGTYYENESYEITVPASTTADLVVYNGTREINRIAVENDSAKEETQTYTLATLLGKTVYNYKPLDNGQDGLTLSIENAQVSKSGIESFTVTGGHFGTTEKEISLEEWTQLQFNMSAPVRIRVRKDTKTLEFQYGSPAHTLSKLELTTENLERWGTENRDEYQGVEFYTVKIPLAEMLGNCEVDKIQDSALDVIQKDEDGNRLSAVDDTSRGQITGGIGTTGGWANGYRFTIKLKDKTASGYIHSKDDNKGIGKHKFSNGEKILTVTTLRGEDEDFSSDESSLLWSSLSIKFTSIERPVSAFQIDGTAYNGAVNITPTTDNEKEEDTILFGNGNVTTKTYIILSGNVGNQTLTFRSISFKNQVSTTGGVELSDILTEGWYFSQNDIKVTIPAYTKSADLVVYSGDTVVSKLSVENKTVQAVTKTYSLEQLFSSANFSGEPNGNLTIKIENVCLTENCYSLEFVDSEDNHVESIEMNKQIDLKKDDSSIIEIYLPSNAVTMVVKNSSFGQELNRLSVDELTYISTSEDGKLKTYQATLGKLLGQSNYQGAIIGFSYLDENGETINITEGELAGRATVARLTFGNEQKVKVNFIEESGTGLKLRISDTTNSYDAEIGDDNMLTMSDLIGSSSSDIYIGQNSCTFVFLDIIKPATGFKINELDYNIGTGYRLNNIFNDTITSPTEKIYYIVKTDGRVFECHVEFLLDS